MLDVKYVLGEDWEGIYINNFLVQEGHKIKFKDGFNIICKHINDLDGVDNIQFSTYDVDQDWLEDQGELPCDFTDIPEDMLEEW